MEIQYQHSIGSNADLPVPRTPFKLADQPTFTFNSPVGLCCDQFKRVWLADTGNNRIVILSPDMTRVVKVYGEPGKKPGQFNMPFRLLHHPEKPWIYISDLANRRVQIVQYSRNLTLSTIKVFGDSGEAHLPLQGPNGLTFCDGKLCVADEFFVNAEGGGRVAIFTENGDFISDIQSIQGATDPGLLWPQGISSDNDGNLYIANTGFYNIVRCDLSGKGVPFAATGTPEIDDLELSRDVSVINNILYVPGGSANHINRYSLDGEALLPLGEFFAPIQVVAHPKSNQHIIVSEPILATVGRYLALDNAPMAVPEYVSGPARNNPGQLYFVTSAITEAIRKPVSPAQQSVTEQRGFTPLPVYNPFKPVEWFFDSVNAWSQNWNRLAGMVFNNRFAPTSRIKNTREDAWLLDSANRQVKRANISEPYTAAEAESLFPLIPGALGVEAFHSPVAIPGQLAPGTALFLVSNYLSGFISVLQYNPYLDDLVHFSFFGGHGSQPWQLNKPQGMAVNDATGDIYIADSGNHRIAHWRISKNGIIGFINTYGEHGCGNGQFSCPSDVSLDHKGNVYVADQMNNRIQVLNSNGEYRYQFGQQGYGTDNDNFLLPTSIQVTRQYLVVNDLVNRSLKVFTHTGQYLSSFSGLGATPNTGQLWMPYLLHATNACDKNTNIGNADHTNDGHTDGESKLIVPDCATNQAHIYTL
ncbi:NHL repeat-containing protein [Alkalimarinus coralli]|uniref:NHL repeat-containing protein n=1 Tax=Alkalimarinus coralli TaxID=2935863 RepID=UPI00202B7A97|nr:NHL repeat-containing protein [Alkalimarinus coralli]